MKKGIELPRPDRTSETLLGTTVVWDSVGVGRVLVDGLPVEVVDYVSPLSL